MLSGCQNVIVIIFNENIQFAYVSSQHVLCVIAFIVKGAITY